MAQSVTDRPLRLRYVEACADQSWHLEIWKRSNPGRHLFIPYTCRSWRCRGRCQLWKGAQDFVRVSEGMAKRDDWVSVVFSYDQKCWVNSWKMYRGGLHLWDRFRKRFRREWGKFDYVQTWEAHKSGKPHVNVAVGNRAFWLACMDDWKAVRRTWVRPHAMSSGFGPVVWVKTIYDRDGMAGYLTKLARELTGSAVKDQTPYNAPPHFRRLRASHGLLPKPFKDPDIEGVLHKCPIHDAHAL